MRAIKCPFKVGATYVCRDGSSVLVEAIRNPEEFDYPLLARIMRVGSDTGWTQVGRVRTYSLDGQWSAIPGMRDLTLKVEDGTEESVVTPIKVDAIVYKGVTFTKAELDAVLKKF